MPEWETDRTSIVTGPIDRALFPEDLRIEETGARVDIEPNNMRSVPLGDRGCCWKLRRMMDDPGIVGVLAWASPASRPRAVADSFPRSPLTTSSMHHFLSASSHCCPLFLTTAVFF